MVRAVYLAGRKVGSEHAAMELLDCAPERARRVLAALESGVHLSCNLTGGVFVNQSAAFSDFHASGANPAANASLTDGAYVANRFRIVQSRRHV